MVFAPEIPLCMAVLLRRHHRLVSLTGHVLFTGPLLRHNGIYHDFLLNLASRLLTIPMSFQQIDLCLPAPLTFLGALGRFRLSAEYVF